MIALNDVKRLYHVGDSTVHALDGVTLSIDKGEFLAVMGPSGSGKSTLLNLVGCIDHPTSGTVEFDGQDVTSMGDKELTKLRLRRIGFVFQQFYLIPTLTALENVLLPMKEARLARGERDARAKELLERFKIAARSDHYPSQLSGGEQQRVAIARALANRPAVILGDEPTGELDSKTADEILGYLLELNGEGLTIILVTHDPRVAGWGQRTVQLLDGKVVSDRPNV